MAGELGLTAPLGGQEAEGDHLPLLIVQPLPGVVVPEAVVRQPLVDVAALLGAAVLEAPHGLPEDVHLDLVARLQAGLGGGGGLSLQRQGDAPGGKFLVDRLQEGEHPADAQIGRRLIDDLLHLHRGDPHVQGGGEHHLEFVHPLAAQQGG